MVTAILPPVSKQRNGIQISIKGSGAGGGEGGGDILRLTQGLEWKIKKAAALFLFPGGKVVSDD